MSVYQTRTTASPVHYRPTREIRLDRTTGALLSASAPRYDTLDEYVQQLASPVSQLRGAAVWSFYDPVAPQLTLLVECEPCAWCARCDRSLEACACAF
jgi:hypothetical protein